MPELRSRTVTHGRNMAGARALMRASGVASEDIGKPIIAVANSFTEFVPGHTHLQPVGRIVSEAIKAAGAVPREFNTIAVDDGIAMGHGGMLYSLPSRDLIADSVEYMVEAHCADALICISNCDKITPGMLMAALRLNIPTVFVSGGPMEAGRATLVDGTVRTLDLIDAIADAVNDKVSDEDILRIEENACPTCGSCSGMFTANSMNCLTEAMGLSLPGNGSVLATHTARKALYEDAGRTVVDLTRRYYEQDDESVLPRSIATFDAFENAMALDIAMGGSTNTILHLLAAAQEAGVPFGLTDIDAVSRRVPCLAKVAPNVAKSRTYYMEDVHRAGGIPALLGELHRGGLLNEDVHAVHSPLSPTGSRPGTSAAAPLRRGRGTVARRPRLRPLRRGLLPVRALGGPGHRRRGGLHPLRRARLLQGRRPGRAARQPRRRRLRGQDRGRGRVHLDLRGPGRGLRVPGGGRRQDPPQGDHGGRRRRHPLRGPQGRPRHAGDALPHLLPQGPRPRQVLRPDHRRPLLRRHLRPLHRPRLPEAASGGTIALVEDGDRIRIDIPGRSIELLVPEEELAARRTALGGAYAPRARERKVSLALKAYAAMATSADKGAVRDVSKLER